MADLDTQDIDTGSVAPANIPGPEHVDSDGSLIDKPQRLSVRDSIKASIKEVEAKESVLQPGKTSKDASVEESSPAEKSAGSDERQRGPDGKFVKADDAVKGIPATGTDAAPLQASAPSDGMPSAWSKDKAPIWQSMSKEAQAYIAQRESQVSEGFKHYGDIKRRHDEIEHVLGPVRSFLQGKGVSDAQAIQTWRDWAMAVDRNPQQAIAQLAAQYGVNLSTARDSQPQADGPSEIPSQLRPVLDQFGNQINSVSQELAALKAQEEQRQREITNQLVQQFAQTKNADGSLMYPHFEQLRELMGRMMAVGIAPNLETAYSSALGADPNFRAQTIKDEITKAEEARKKQQADNLAKAKAANVSVRGSAPGGSVANGSNRSKKGLSVRESINQAIEEARNSRA